MEDGRLAQPSLPTLPGTDETIGRQGPGVQTGRLGTLVLIQVRLIRARFWMGFSMVGLGIAKNMLMTPWNSGRHHEFQL